MSTTDTVIPTARKRVPRRAVPAVEVPLARSELEALLAQNDFADAALALARALELDTPDLADAPRRLGIFAGAFAAEPGLRRAAVEGDTPQILAAWSEYACQQAASPRFWHAFVMLLRERMILVPAGWSPQRTLSLTALWVCVFCSRAFWEYFPAMIADAASGTTPPSGEEMRELFEWTIQEWLAVNKVEAEKAFLQASDGAAAGNIAILRMVGDGEAAIRATLDDVHWMVDLPFDPARLEFARQACDRYLAELDLLALNEAERSLSGGAGSAERFDAPISLLTRYLAVRGDGVRILTTLLDWHVQSARAKAPENSPPVLERAAATVATRLERYATPGDELRQENILLASYYVCAAEAQNEPNESHRLAETALKWNPRDERSQFFSGLFQLMRNKHNRAAFPDILASCEQRGFSNNIIIQLSDIIEGAGT